MKGWSEAAYAETRRPQLTAVKPSLCLSGEYRAGGTKRNPQMVSSPKNGLTATALALVLVILVLGLVALIRCPAQEIPAAIQAFGSWLRISIQI